MPEGYEQPRVYDERLREGGRPAIVSETGVVVWWAVLDRKRAEFKDDKKLEQWARVHFGAKDFDAAWKIIQEEYHA